jgi:hypothetical protein
MIRTFRGFYCHECYRDNGVCACSCVACATMNVDGHTACNDEGDNDVEDQCEDEELREALHNAIGQEQESKEAVSVDEVNAPGSGVSISALRNKKCTRQCEVCDNMYGTEVVDLPVDEGWPGPASGFRTRAEDPERGGQGRNKRGVSRDTRAKHGHARRRGGPCHHGRSPSQPHLRVRH